MKFYNEKTIMEYFEVLQVFELMIFQLQAQVIMGANRIENISKLSQVFKLMTILIKALMIT